MVPMAGYLVLEMNDGAGKVEKLKPNDPHTSKTLKPNNRLSRGFVGRTAPVDADDNCDDENDDVRSGNTNGTSRRKSTKLETRDTGPVNMGMIATTMSILRYEPASQGML